MLGRIDKLWDNKTDKGKPYQVIAIGDDRYSFWDTKQFGKFREGDTSSPSYIVEDILTYVGFETFTSPRFRVLGISLVLILIVVIVLSTRKLRKWKKRRVDN